MKHLLLTLACLLGGTLSVFAMSNDNKKSVSLNTDKTVYPGRMYKEYKDFYNSKEYVRQPGDPYSPFWVGFAECFIPGLGEGIAGEWGRAAGFFFANVGLGAIAFSQRIPYYYNGYTYYKYNDLYWVMMAARLCLNIWSICDAVHVAKVKNMYYQDLRAQRASLDFGLEPYFACAPYSVSGMQPVAGLSLKVRF